MPNFDSASVKLFSDSAMPFQNEYSPPLEKEPPGALRNARERLKGIHSIEAWAVDRTNQQALYCSGRGHDIDSRDEEYWCFLDGETYYRFVTRLISQTRITKGPPEVISITRDIMSFWSGEQYAGMPDARTMQSIKEAFRVYGGYCMASRDIQCTHILLWNGEPV